MSRTINAERVFARAQIIAANARYTEADGRAIGEVKTEHLLAGIVLVKDTGAYNELESCGMIEPLMAQLRSQSTINPRDLDDLVLEAGVDRYKDDPFSRAKENDLPLSANAQRVVKFSSLTGLKTEQILERLREHGVSAKILAAAESAARTREEAKGEAKGEAK